jgi:CRISPR-associated protein Cmr2
MKKQYLLLFTIGPVKSFINDSRKTQDLFGGSSLLSFLMHTAIDTAKNSFDSFELITPVYDIDNYNQKKPGIPNRFIAIIYTDNIQTNMDKVKSKVIDTFAQIPKIDNLPKGAQVQLEKALDIHWVAIPVSDNYKNDFIRINQELAAKKNIRVFDNQKTETGRKCMVDGRRNVKFYRRNKTDEKYKNDNDLARNKLFQHKNEVNIYKENDEKELKIWHLQEGEGISAVTLRKRMHLNDPHKFPSTVAVSLMDLFEKLKGNENFITFKNKVQGTGSATKYLSHSDDQLFYRENIKAIINDNTKSDTCIKEHEDWSKNLEIPITKYYALVRFDGDNMGDWFTGKYFTDETKLKENQIALSTALGNFGKTIKDNIGKPIGKVIYAGGEDFMAFINIHHLKKAVDIIQDTFKQEVIDSICKISNHTLSISMGIAIAHYKQPLAMVLQKAKDMEKLAKDSGRNGFAMAVIKHSGTTIHTRYKWNKCDIDAFAHLDSIRQKLNDKIFSPQFIINIYRAFETYGFNMEDFLVKSKIDLYVSQAYNGDKQNKQSEFTLMTGWLKDLLSISHSNRNFADALLLIDFLYRKSY